MPKGYNVDDILDEFEARHRPRGENTKPSSVSAARQPFKLKSFADTADLLPQRKLSENPEKDDMATRIDLPAVSKSAKAQPIKKRPTPVSDIGATRLDLPVVTPTKPDLGKTLVIDRHSIISAMDDEEPSTDVIEKKVETEKEKKDRFRKFASVTAIPDDDDMAEEDDEENFMGFGKKKQAAAIKEKKKEKRVDNSRVDYDEEALDEFSSPGDAKIIERDLASLKLGLTIRLVTSFFGFAGLLYLAMMAVLPDIIPFSTFILEQPFIYMLINIGVTVAVCLFSNKVLGGGLISLLKLRPTNDSPLAFAALAAIAFGTALTAGYPSLEPGYSSFYFVVVALGFFFNALGKLLMVNRILGNFKLIQKDEVTLIKSLDSLSGEFGGRIALMPVRTRLAKDFLGISYSDDLNESLSRITVPIFIGFSIVAATITFFIYGDLMLSMTALASMLLMSSPLTSTFCGNLPMFRAFKCLSPSGGAVCGYSALDIVDDAEGVILDAADLFPRSGVVLHGIKAFAQGRIDDAIISAASIMCETDSLLSDVFLKVIGGRRDMLGKVTETFYEDNRGIRALVNGKQIYIGNRELMRAHGIAAPSRDYEKKFISDGRDILYLADENEVTAMFVVGYNHDESLETRLNKLCARGTTLMVKTNDPNITREKVSEAFSLKDEYVLIVPDSVAVSLPDKAVQDSVPSYIVASGKTADKLRCVSAVYAIRGAIVSSTSIELIGMIIGYALTAFTSCIGSINTFSAFQILIYQLFWALLTLIGCFTGRI